MTVILLTAAFVHVHANSVAQKVSLSGKDLTLKQVFAAVENQTGFVVFYNEKIFTNTKTVSLSVHDMPLKDFLEVVLKEQPLEYVIQDKTIFLSRRPMVEIPQRPNQLLDEPTPPVSGVVRSADGEPNNAIVNRTASQY